MGAGAVRGSAVGSPYQARPEGKESELFQKPVPVVDSRANWRGHLTRRGVTGLWLRDTASLQLSHREEARVEKP